jgi:arylsulfatase A-like enzyme
MADNDDSQADRQTAARSTFWYGFWLAVVLITCKWMAWHPLNYLRRTPSPHPFRDLSVVTSVDLLFAILASLAFQAPLSLLRRRPRAARAVWGVWVGFCVLCVAYAVVSIAVFHELRAPLTYSLISLSRNVKNMSASLSPALSWKLGVAMLAAPAVYWLVSALCDRLFQPRRTLFVRAVQVVGLAFIVGRALIIQRAYLPDWKWEPDRRLTENPHWTLIRSLATDLAGFGAPHLPDDFPKAYLDDFQPQPTATKAVSPRPRNVILLVLESVGTQYLGVYGSPYDTTPNLGRELQHAVVFDNFYSHDGMTTCSLLAIINATYPQVGWWPDTDRSPDIGGVSVAQALRPHGYRSAFITSGGLDWAGEDRFLAHRGFDQVIDARTLSKTDGSSWGVADRHVFEAMFDWIDRGDRHKPFFTVAWTLATHHPYFIEDEDGPEIDFLREHPAPAGAHPNLNRYLNTLRNADRKMAALFAGLRERGLADDTLVIITGDHGECFNAPHATLCHGWHIWDENCHVPLVMWNPRMFPTAGGKRIDTLGGHVDLNPTILDVLGFPAPAGAWQGRSLFADARPPRVYFFAALGDYQIGLRQDHWKLIYNATLGENQLFDLRSDPTEQRDVASQHPELCKDLRQRLAAWLSYQDRHLAGLRASPNR